MQKNLSSLTTQQTDLKQSHLRGQNKVHCENNLQRTQSTLENPSEEILAQFYHTIEGFLL